MSINQLNLTDIQFSGKTDTDQKLRRLVQDLQAAERAINTLLNEVAQLESSGGDVGPFLLANPELTDTFTVENLTPGAVLKALTATSAAFAKLSINDLSNVFIEMPGNGQVLTYVDGEWINAAVPAGGGAQGVNLGGGVDVYAGISGGKLAFRSFTSDGGTIGITFTGDEINLEYAGPMGLTFQQASAITSIRI